MNRRRAAPATLFTDAPTTEQPRRQKPEPPRIYDAVLKLRRQGWYVTRAGRDQHMLRGHYNGFGRGRVVSTELLLTLAAK